MAFIIQYLTPIHDGNDAVIGSRTHRFNDTVYESVGLPLALAERAGIEAYDVCFEVVDLTTGRRVYRPVPSVSADLF